LRSHTVALCHPTRRAATSILQVCPNAGPALKAHTLEAALALSTSPLLQDAALESMVAFFRQMVVSKAIDVTELRFLLYQRATDKVGKHGLYNLARCVSVVTVVDPASSHAVLAELCSTLEGSGSSPVDKQKVRQVQLALLVTGNLGRQMDLSNSNGMPERLKAVYVSYFDSSSDDLKHAAAYALGNASVGSQSTFLPAIVAKLDDGNKKMQYLLLSSLREFIQCSFHQKGDADITASIPVILPPLVKHFSDEEEGVRAMVAECIGSLTSLHAAIVLPKLDEIMNSHSKIDAPDCVIADDDAESTKNSLVCSTIATSIKLALANKVDPAIMSQYMPSFVRLLEQKELNVRNAALLMTYSAIHHSPQVVAPLLKDLVVPCLYEVSDLKKERKVDLGPFTHRVDDALPLRKSALSIFATCLETVPNSIDISAFMPVLTKALGDAEDIQLHAHQIVISMCSRHPLYIVSAVDSFVDPLDKTLNKKPGQKTGTELERLNDWIKSALRVVVTLAKVDGIMNSRLFGDFLSRVKSNSRFTAMLEKVEES
jgi:cullin-associated NEDD8-dissociated protein 1